MEGIILLLLLIVLFVFVLPLVALVKASGAKGEVERLSKRVRELERELRAGRGGAVGSQEPEPAAMQRARKPSPEPAAAPSGPSEEEVVWLEEAEPAMEEPALPPPLPARAVGEPAEPVAGGPPPQTPPAPKLPGGRAPFNWEHFMGAKLFAWIGGLALFLGIAFFVKYAFDRDLIPPGMRVALGFAAGLGLVGGGYLTDRKKYAITSHALCATGVLVLYATTFACRAVYHFEFFGLIPTFLLMALITVTAFLLAVRLDAVSVAVLGLAGGFLTPVVLSIGNDYPIGLFGYIALLNLGLLGVAFRKRWDFLAALGAVGTVILQWDWYHKFFEVPKAGLGLGIFLFFAALFLGASCLLRRRGRVSDWFSVSAGVLAGSAFLFAALGLGFVEIAGTPAIVLTAVFGPCLCLVALSLICPNRPVFHAAGAVIGFSLLAIWLGGKVAGEGSLLPWMLGACFGFALLHTVFPLVAERLGIGAHRSRWLHAFPLLALVLMLFPVSSIEGLPLLTWPVVFAITALAVVASVIWRTPWLVAGALLLTLLVLTVWVLEVPAETSSTFELMAVIGFFAVVIFGVTCALRGRLGGPQTEEGLECQAAWEKPFNALTPHLPAASAALPFALLVMVAVRLPLVDPSPVFGVAVLLAGLLLGLACLLPNQALPLVGLGCVVALQQAWQETHLAGAIEAGSAIVPLLWHVSFFAAFALFPFVVWRRVQDSILPWIASALSGPLHFYLVHHLVGGAYPNEFMGLIPALFAVPSLASLVVLTKLLPLAAARRTAQLAWFGGVALFFITLVFPIQFDREWITIGWALEGVALIWLFHRVPHPGLRLTGLALLAVVFVRLALNPAVLSYHPRGELPILNWYLYTYGIGTACFFVAGWLLHPPRERVHGLNVPPLLGSLGTVLAFLLVNIEIADFFTAEGESALTFEFSGHFGRDMTYTIAWSLFALVLVVVGLLRRIPGWRYAGLGLLAVALLKLFLHDLANLEALYRIGALIGTAVIAIFASFLYQKLLSSQNPESPEADEDPPAPES